MRTTPRPRHCSRRMGSAMMHRADEDATSVHGAPPDDQFVCSSGTVRDKEACGIGDCHAHAACQSHSTSTLARLLVRGIKRHAVAAANGRTRRITRQPIPRRRRCGVPSAFAVHFEATGRRATGRYATRPTAGRSRAADCPSLRDQRAEMPRAWGPTPGPAADVSEDRDDHPQESAWRATVPQSPSVTMIRPGGGLPPRNRPRIGRGGVGPPPIRPPSASAKEPLDGDNERQTELSHRRGNQTLRRPRRDGRSAGENPATSRWLRGVSKPG